MMRLAKGVPDRTQQQRCEHQKPLQQDEERLPGLDASALHHLQEQLLREDEFAEDLRAVLLACFRAKHLSKAAGASAKAPNELKNGDLSNKASLTNTAFLGIPDDDDEDIKRMKSPGHELEAQEQMISRGSTGQWKENSWGESKEADGPVCDQRGLLQKLKELKYTATPGLRRVPFVETLAIVAQADVARDESSDRTAQIDVAEDLRREAVFTSQLQKTIPDALLRLRVLGLQISRSPDFLAEMLKSDSQMGRIRARIDAEQQQQREFERKRNQRLDRKFNKLSGNQIVREQEEIRRRNMQLRAIDQWKKNRQAAIREGTAIMEAEDEFDQWLLGNEYEQKNVTPSHGRSFKLKGSAGRRGHNGHARKGHSRRGKAITMKRRHPNSLSQGKTGKQRKKRHF